MTQNKIIVVLSGEIASGKSTLARNMAQKYSFTHLKSKDAILKATEGKKNNRLTLQKRGERLDTETNGKWLVSNLQSKININPRIIIDSVRILEQIISFREAYGYQNVYHIHLQAGPETLKNRFFKRSEEKENNELADYSYYEKIKRDKTEQKVIELAKEADLVLNTENCDEDDNLIRVASFLRLLPSTSTKSVDVVIGAQFGSEGKGQIAAYLAPNYDCLVRVGGPNAGHKVYEQNEPNTFHLIPSGSKRAPNSKIVIGPGAIISIDVILSEIKEFGLERSRLLIDENATIISKDDIKNEAGDSIGSTRQGVGYATANNIIYRLKNITKYKAYNCKELKQYIGNSHELFEELYKKNEKILLEGTQGTFLSLHHGFFPYVTSRDTTASGCLAEAGISPFRVNKIVLVTRRYPIRVDNPDGGGTSGPFSKSEYKNLLQGEESPFLSEISASIISERSGIDISEIEKTEITSTTKKKRRIAEFNWALFREACELNSPTDIALTFADYISGKNKLARRYDQLTHETTKFIEELERCSGVSVSMIANGFNYRSVIDRRNWI